VFVVEMAEGAITDLMPLRPAAALSLLSRLA